MAPKGATMKFKLGDKVRYSIGNCDGDGLFLGTMTYASNVILLGTERSHGMPVNASHCILDSCGHEVEAARLRDRYVSLYGEDKLRPIP